MLYEIWRKEKEQEFTVNGVVLPLCSRMMLAYFKRKEGETCETCVQFKFDASNRRDICKKEISPNARKRIPSKWYGNWPACGLHTKDGKS